MAYQYIYESTLEDNIEAYVKRDADEELYQALIQGKICKVFNSRKTGKSSLANRITKRLREEAQVSSVFIDISIDDSKLEQPDQWYTNMIDTLNFELNLDFDWETWWNEKKLLSPLRRFRQFIELVLLAKTTQNIVIFLDEIDSVLSFQFSTDDLFAFIRGLYNLRTRNSEYKRLTFCLLGVIDASDLIRDRKRTPFNVGQAIELKGFTFKQAAPVLTEGLVEKFGKQASEVLETIINWTGGQPFFTQKLCDLVRKFADANSPNVDEIVETYILDNWEVNDDPELLKTIRNRLVSEDNEKIKNRSGRLLSIYQQILTNGQIPADNSPDQMELQLSGLVVKENGHLKVYNPIYQAVFNLNWVQQQLANLRPYQENFQAWIESDKKDDSRLLRGEALDEALKWKEGKRLSDDDTTFFDASQRYQIETLRQAEAKAKEIIKAAQEGTKIERLGVHALRRFNTKTGQLQALHDARKAGEYLQKLLEKWENLVKDNSELAVGFPAASPFLALQTILSKIRERHTFIGHTDLVSSVSFSPDGKYLATGSWDNTAILWSMETKAKLYIFTSDNNPVTSVSFSPDGKYLATGSSDNTFKVWSMETKAELHTFTGYSDPLLWDSLWGTSFSPDGKYRATGLRDNTAIVWSMETKAKLHIFTGHTDLVSSVSFSSDGKYLATGSDDKTAKVWSMETKAELHTFTGHTGSVESLTFSSDSKYLATGSDDKTAKVWSMETKAELYTFTGHTGSVESLTFSSDSKYLATGSDDNTVIVWSIETKAELHTFIGHTNLLRSLSFSPDGKYLATGSHDNTAIVWSMETKAKLHTFTSRHNKRVTSVSFSPDGKYLATGSWDKTAKVWSMETKAELHTFIDHTHWVTSVSFSPDGKYLATGSQDKTAKVWSMETKAELYTFIGHTRSVTSVSFSPDGKYLATGSQDKTAKVWSMETKAELYTFIGHTHSVSSVSFSPDDKYLATGSHDNTAILWSIETKPEIYTFIGHTHSVRSVSFSSDGKYLATGSSDNTAKVWDLSGNLIADFVGYQDGWQFIEIKSPVLSVSFSPDGKYLAASYDDGVVRLWPVENLNQLLARAREWLQLD